MAVKLHRCKNTWVKIPMHPCWKVQRELDKAGVGYEVVTGPTKRGDRADTVEKTGQNKYPWIEFEDGSVYREESKAMAERIRSGTLADAPRTGSTAA